MYKDSFSPNSHNFQCIPFLRYFGENMLAFACRVLPSWFKPKLWRLLNTKTFLYLLKIILPKPEKEFSILSWKVWEFTQVNLKFITENPFHPPSTYPE